MSVWYLSVTAHIFLYADLWSVCKGLTTAMCCLACVVRLARTQTLGLSVRRWWLAARLKAWPGAQGSLYKSLPLKLSQSSDLTEFHFNVCDSPTHFLKKLI